MMEGLKDVVSGQSFFDVEFVWKLMEGYSRQLREIKQKKINKIIVKNLRGNRGKGMYEMNDEKRQVGKI